MSWSAQSVQRTDACDGHRKCLTSGECIPHHFLTEHRPQRGHEPWWALMNSNEHIDLYAQIGQSDSAAQQHSSMKLVGLQCLAQGHFSSADVSSHGTEMNQKPTGWKYSTLLPDKGWITACSLRGKLQLFSLGFSWLQRIKSAIFCQTLISFRYVCPIPELTGRLVQLKL